ncbi:hypothetical protein [Rhodoblastus sp.]|uniref:hypothetical protein n=1 Tax=Rhodoblastus sp. TaxID=1962975 RepID=UPI0035AE9543
MGLMERPMSEGRANSFHSNPFFVLGATTRDSQSRLVELAEERALLLDPDACQKARADLVSPRSRLPAELAWLPGVSPRRAGETVEKIGKVGRAELRELPALARANVVAAQMQVSQPSAKDALGVLEMLLSAAGDVDVDEVMRDVNEDRSVAGVPPLKDTAQLEAELAARRRHFRDASRDYLDRLPSSDLLQIVVELAANDTGNGARSASALAQDIADAFEAGAQGFMTKERDNIDALIARIRSEADTAKANVAGSVQNLCAALASWSKVTGPLQLICRAKGIDHTPSRNVARDARSLAIDLWNEHTLAYESGMLLRCLRKEFGLLAEISEKLDEDAKALEGINAERAKAETERRDYENSFALAVDFGVLRKERLNITISKVTWKGRDFEMNRINRLRWGGVRKSVNGIHTGTTYHVHMGTPNDNVILDVKDNQIFSDVVDRLWRGAGVRMSTEWAQKLKSGSAIYFPNLTVYDRMVAIKRHHFFKASEDVMLDWSEINISNEAGCFVISARNGQKARVSLSYLEVDNVPILENMIRALFNTGKATMGSLLD